MSRVLAAFLLREIGSKYGKKVVRPMPGHIRRRKVTSGTGMSYILLLVQKYQPSAAGEFLKLEADFEELEHSSPQFPQGRRYQLLSEGEPANTLLWKCEFASLEDVQKALKKMADDPTHSALFEKQLPYIVEMQTEIYKVLDLSAHKGPHERV